MLAAKIAEMVQYETDVAEMALAVHSAPWTNEMVSTNAFSALVLRTLEELSNAVLQQ